MLSNITYDLRNSKIKTLVAKKLQCSNGLSLVLKIKHIIKLQNTTLKELSLAGNMIALIEHKLMTYLPKSLKYLNVEDNAFIFGVYLYEGDFLSNIERLDIGHAGFYRPDYEISCKYNSDNCDQNEETPHKTQSEVATNSQNQTYQLPPKLKYLNIANQRISLPTDLNHGVRIRSRNSLTHLYASGNIFDYIPSFVFSGLQHLQHADLSNAFCLNITKEAFRDLNMLSLLNLSRNLLGGILKNQASSDLFKVFPN